MTKTVKRLVAAYDKAVADFEALDCSSLDVRYTWALNRVYGRAEDLAKAISRHVKSEEKKAAWRPKQCDYVTRNGTSGYLCCRYKPNHKVAHRTGYLNDESKPEDWMPLAVWQEKYSAAAAACYAQPGRARALLCKWCGQSQQNHIDGIGGARDCSYQAGGL